ncbi:MAG TPA: type II secretion system inner membrane protein GspF [Sphingomonas sp.]|nr:type II secretion system inner membrane protein GspF [Sphingomonas sp.]
MAEFAYLAIAPSGKEQHGRIAADTIEAAKAELDRRKLFVMRVKPAEARASTVPSLLSFDRKTLSGKELTLFTRQAATLIQVSPIEEALRTIARQSEKPHVRKVIDRVHAGIVEGRRLAEAMGSAPKSFPLLYRAMVSAGERSGSLPLIMERLADLLERQAEMRGKVITAIAYPLILAVFAIVVVAALMVFVVPKVVEQFDTMGQTLPLLTRVVMGLSTFLAHWWWALLLGLGLLAAIAWRALRHEPIRYAADRAVLRTPVIGRLLRDLHAARMARTLATMVASRLPLMEGLALTAQTVHNRVLRRASDEIVEAIRGGGSLSAALRRAGVFPPLLVYLAASGESAGQLDTMLARAADYLEREFDAFTSVALSMLEPAIIIAMGAIVAVIVLSILLPILQLQSLTGA